MTYFEIATEIFMKTPPRCRQCGADAIWYWLTVPPDDKGGMVGVDIRIWCRYDNSIYHVKAEDVAKGKA
jgi:hypothetical protein